MKKLLDSAVSLALILACLVFIATQIRSWLAPAPSAVPQAAPGERLEALRPVVEDHADRTVVLAVSPGCRYCKASIPFYQRLVALRDDQHLKARIVALVANSSLIPIQQSIFEQEGLEVDSLSAAPFAQLKVSRVPSLYIADREGTVLHQWVGMLDEAGQKEVLAALSERQESSRPSESKPKGGVE